MGKYEHQPLHQKDTTSRTDWGQLAGRQPTNLPVPLSPLVGREQEAEELVSFCSNPDKRMITITGMGGSGKTRLAVEVAHKVLPLFTQGCWLVSFDSQTTPEFMPEVICATLMLPHSSRADRKTQLLYYLNQRNLLLVLDDLEHLLPQALPLLNEILENAPGVKILATSRERLNAPAEQVFRLGGLKYPKAKVHQPGESYGALNLFIEHLRRLGYRFLDEDFTAAAQVCRMVEGLPLALILAAQWRRVLTCSEIAEELARGQQLRVLQAPAQLNRHVSLQVVFEESWKFLTEKEQVCLRRLSVFSGDFTREAAAEVAGADMDLLAALLDKSLIERPADLSFRVHALLRQFLHEKLEEAGEAAAARDAHLNYYCRLAEHAEPELYSHDQAAWCKRLDTQYTNTMMALTWGLAPGDPLEVQSRHENGVRLAQALWYYWHLRWGWQEGRKWYTQCLALPLERLSPMIQVRAWVYAAMFESMTGEWGQAAEWAERGLSLARHFEIEDGVALALLRQGGVLRMKDPLQGRALIEQALAMYRQLTQPFYTCTALFYLGQEWHDTPKESQYYQECLDLSLKIGNRRYAAFSLFNLGGMACQHGDLHASRLYHEKSHVLMKEMNDVGGIFISCKLLGGDYLLLKAFDQAEKLFQECLQIAETTGDYNFLAEAYVKIGQLHQARGEHQLAADLFQKGWMANWKSGASGATVQAYQGLGLVALDEKSYASAATYFCKALALHAELSGLLEVFDWLEILVCLAATLAASGQAAPAAVLFGAVSSLSTKAGYQFHPSIQAIHDSGLAHARERLDPRRFTEAWQRGAPLTLEEAIRIGLEPAPQAEALKNTAAPYPGGLSAREVEVLRLVAQGMTDAQIAKELVLSPRTINAHLNSIFRKLGIKSRASATRFAVEQGLL